MNQKLIRSLFVSLIVLPNAVIAQGNDCPCCQGAYTNFDFWVGQWEVSDTNGRLVGENKIVKLQDRCVIQENWKAPKVTGTSYNYFDRNDSLWHQVWIDNTGGSLVLKGQLTGKSMVLRSDTLEGKQGMYFHEVNWTPHEDGSVHQIWTLHALSSENQTVLFHGIYKRKNEADE